MKSIREIAHNLRVDVHAVWLAARDAETPLLVRLLGLLVAGYALSPIDLIPDFIPVLGLLDDAVLIPLGVWLFVRLVPAPVFARCRAEAETASGRPISRIGAITIVALWIAAASWLVLLLWGVRFY